MRRVSLVENVDEGIAQTDVGYEQRFAHAFPEATASGGAVNSERSGQTSFEAVFIAHWARIVGILRRMVGDHARAEDLASEAFLKLYRRPPTASRDNNVAGWLYRTATNLGIDALRAAVRHEKLEASASAVPNVVAENGLDHLLRAEKQQRVRQVLADLKPSQAQLLILRASGHSYKELAVALEVEPSSVGTLLVRAEAAFEKRHRELFGGEEDA
jgi:RNA polymerase sigma-70 factor, ECF subfamily